MQGASRLGTASPVSSEGTVYLADQLAAEAQLAAAAANPAAAAAATTAGNSRAQKGEKAEKGDFPLMNFVQRLLI